MHQASINIKLSKYQKFILNTVIVGLEANKEFNIYDRVKKAVSQKCILSNQNALVDETGYTLKDYLLANEFAVEKNELTAYILTEKGCQLLASQTIEQFEEKLAEKNRPSFLRRLFRGPKDNKWKSPAEDETTYYE